jgi:hypothetical protein
MSPENLVFSGVNGATGGYGLPPMTDKDLADHVLERPSEEQRERRRLEAELRRGTAKKVSAIVEFLAASNAEETERDDEWEDRWLGELAQLLATEVLRKEYTDTQLEPLKARLSRHTEDKLADIATFLVEHKAEELASLLLTDQDEAPDNARDLKEQLKRDALTRLAGIRSTLLSEDLAMGLDCGGGMPEEWLASFITELYLVPISALNSLQGVRIRPQELLGDKLVVLQANIGSEEVWLTDLIAQVSQPGMWNDFLEALREQLQVRIRSTPDLVSWAALFDTLRSWLDGLRRPLAHLGVIAGVDATDLKEAGWGIIFPAEKPGGPSRFAAIAEKLKPLLDKRKQDAGDLYREFKAAQGYRYDDTARKFLGRHSARPEDPADPRKVPYYLLIVGSPEEIPFHFQYQLDVQYAVGRIHFDQLGDYANYASTVVAAEAEAAAQASDVAFFDPVNPGDDLTKNSAEKLVQPLYQQLHRKFGPEHIHPPLAGEAFKENLKGFFGGEETPNLLFAACHGVEFPKGDNRQLRHQGALVCREWPGPDAGPGELPEPPDYYFSADDLADGDDLKGMIAFFFACYGAGTPRFDEFSKRDFKEKAETITDRPFVAALPKRMLSLPNGGGALAVIGHVERAWGVSFLGDRKEEQIAVFQSAVQRLLEGVPVGYAMEYMNGRYAALSTELNAAIERKETFGMRVSDYDLAQLWTASNDARGYIVIGDPAVRLRVKEKSEE